jgi:hypothetical protein
MSPGGAGIGAVVTGGDAGQGGEQDAATYETHEITAMSEHGETYLVQLQTK